MALWFKILWWAAVVLNVLAILVFIFAATDNFQQSMDLESHFSLFMYGMPSCMVIAMSLGGLLLKKVGNRGAAGYITGSLTILLLLLMVSIHIKETKHEIYKNLYGEGYNYSSNWLED